MQSLIASQQQLIRRVNTSVSTSMNTSGNTFGTTSVTVTPLERHDSTTNISTSEGSSMSAIMSSVSNNNTDSVAGVQCLDNYTTQEINVYTSSDKSIDKSTDNISSDGKKSIESKSNVKKKRSNSSWLNLLSPSYKTRHEEFKRLFSSSVPNNERLVVDYSCALQKEILVHGRVYVSLNYLTFYANIFKWETSVVIKCRDITSLTKANTARVIPNAIQVITNSGDKYIFTSFAARDKTYVMIFRIWQNALLDEPVSNAQVWQWVHYSYGDDLGLTSDDDDYTCDINTSPQVMTEHCDSCSSSDEESSSIDVYEDAIDSPMSWSQCSCAQHEGKLILNITLPVTIDRAFQFIFTDSKFLHNLHKSRRTYDLTISQWEDTPKDKVRQLNYTVLTNHAFVKSAPTIEKQHLLPESTAGIVYMVRSEADNEGVPYCDTFSVHSQWCLTMDSVNVTRLKVHAKVFYKKNVWGLGLMKPVIEKSAIQGVTDFCTHLSNQLPHWIQMEESLVSIDVNELPLNAKNDLIDPNLSIRDNVIKNGVDISELQAIGSSDHIQTNLVSKYLLSAHLNDSFLLKLIFLILLLLFFLNIIVFIRLRQIESQSQDFNSFLFTSQHFSDNSLKWKQFIDNAIKLVRLIENNLNELRKGLKDEL